MFDVAVIGCGITGAAVACVLARREVSVVVLEAENDVAMGTTKANSAILHAGYDPEPGTRMAKWNVRGAALAKELCEALDVPRKQIGSLVLAFTDEEVPHLEKLLANGIANGVEGLRILTAQEVAEMEPHLAPVKAALYAPSAAIVNPWEYAIALAENAVENGAQVRLSSAVTGAERTEQGWLLHTKTGDVEARFVVNAAGVRAGEVHEMAAPRSFETHPCRGEYYLLDKCEGTRVSHVIFQCPNKLGKGVLVSPTVHGNLIVGPNADDANSVANTASGLAFVAETARKSVPDVDLRHEEPRPDGGARRGRGRRARAGGGRAGRARQGRSRHNAPEDPFPRTVRRGARKTHGRAAGVRPRHLPLRDDHRGRDHRRLPRGHPAVQHRRCEAPRGQRHGPLSGRVLRTARDGDSLTRVRARPACHPAGRHGQLHSDRTHQGRRHAP